MKIYHGKSNHRSIRDYSKRRYGNPLFRQNARGRAKAGIGLAAAKRIAIAVIAVAAFGTLCWYLLWSGTFRIENIEITGAAQDTESVIRGIVEERLGMRRAIVLPQSSIFMFDVEGAKTDITDEFYFDRLEVRKRLPDTLVIDIGEKQMVATFLAGGRFLALDQSGFVIRELTERESMMMKDLPEGMGAVTAGELGAEAVDVSEIAGATVDPDAIKHNDNPNPLIIEKGGGTADYVPGYGAVAQDALALMLQAYALLPDVTGSGVKWFSLDPAADSVDVTLKAGWGVYLTTLLPFDIQRERLSLVLNEKIGERRAELQYVDLRYDERIFYRFKEAE